jgi:hypothetical protein
MIKQMLKHKLFIEQFILISVITMLHYAGLQLYLYWTFWWFDIFMHFLGGLWFGVVSIWFFFFSGFTGRFKSQLTARYIFTVSIVSVMIIGALWEIFEIYAGVTRFTIDYQLDTSIDLIMDMFGAVVASIYTVIEIYKKQII